jgi:very-short-patch-repair endonuclease
MPAGVTKAEIEQRLRSGVLLLEYPGIYRVGHRAPSVEASYLAAVWACGDKALLSGRAAGFHWGLMRGEAPRPETIAPTRRCVKGVKTSQRRLVREDGTIRHGIPITTVERTLVDLAAELSLSDLARACHEAGVKYRTTPRAVEKVLARRPNAKGAANLRAVLTGEVRVSLSALERRFVALLSAGELPLPQTNKPAGSYRVDCRWPEHRLTVELDSYRYHNSRQSWEQDRRREREARARGDEFRRYTYEDVFERPAPMLEDLEPLLAPG